MTNLQNKECPFNSGPGVCWSTAQLFPPALKLPHYAEYQLFSFHPALQWSLCRWLFTNKTLWIPGCLEPSVWNLLQKARNNNKKSSSFHWHLLFFLKRQWILQMMALLTLQRANVSLFNLASQGCIFDFDMQNCKLWIWKLQLQYVTCNEGETFMCTHVSFEPYLSTKKKVRRAGCNLKICATLKEANVIAPL